MNIQTLPDPAEIEAVLGIDGQGRRGTWRKRGLWLVLTAVMIGMAAWLYWWNGLDANATAYETTQVTRTQLIITVTATGKIQPTTQVDVSSELSGVVRNVNVDNNSLVKRGDVLAELDTERLKAQLDRAKATVTAAEAKVADARATMAERERALARVETLSKKGISTGQDLDTAVAAQIRASAGIDAALADVAVAKADLVLKQTDIDKSRILSPVDGVVLKRAVEPGQTVASSLQAPVLFTLAQDLKRMQVEADVDEADIGAVTTGQQASFTVDAYPGKNFPASIQEVEFSPQTTDNVVTYKAILTVDNSALLLRPGMTATASIVVREIPGALSVPNAALRYTPPVAKPQQGFSLTGLFMPRWPRSTKATSNEAANGERKLWVLDNGVAREVSVTTGASDGKLTEIIGGALAEGDAVITQAAGTGK
ncbi:MAG: efflux RND transporter periplasmic adaptor subunit [Aestuariivirga sp.]